MANKLRIDDIVNVVVSTAGATLPREGFNVGLIVGTSAVVPAAARVKTYSNLEDMLNDGFTVTDAEYLAAKLYFTQSKKPYKVAIGRAVITSVTESATAVAKGTGVTGATVTAATFGTKVKNVEGRYVFNYDGAWKLNGEGVTASQYGLTIQGAPTNGDSITVAYTPNITSESWVDALEACKDASGEWYGVMAVGDISAANHLAIAQWCDNARACYFYSDNAAADITSATNDVFSNIKTAGITRAVGLYSATAYAAAAVMGFAMGANDGTVGSAYTLAYKSLNGVEVDALNAVQVKTLQSKNANYYVNRGGNYNVLEKGVCANGTWFDELIGTDQLANDIQMACMNVLTQSQTKVPYTDAGALQFVLACNEACAQAVATGFLTAGVWEGNSVLNLDNGDTLEAGYICQAAPVAGQSVEDRINRVCPPIYVCAILANAIHSVTIKVDVE